MQHSEVIDGKVGRMDGMLALCAALAAGLFLYLLVALWRAEDF
jgi:K+-transporting ATPase KdpF subunit